MLQSCLSLIVHAVDYSLDSTDRRLLADDHDGQVRVLRAVSHSRQVVDGLGAPVARCCGRCGDCRPTCGSHRRKRNGRANLCAGTAPHSRCRLPCMACHCRGRCSVRSCRTRGECLRTVTTATRRLSSSPSNPMCRAVPVFAALSLRPVATGGHSLAHAPHSTGPTTHRRRGRAAVDVHCSTDSTVQ